MGFAHRQRQGGFVWALAGSSVGLAGTGLAQIDSKLGHIQIQIPGLSTTRHTGLARSNPIQAPTPTDSPKGHITFITAGGDYKKRLGGSQNYPTLFLGGGSQKQGYQLWGGSQNNILGPHKIRLLVRMIYKIFAATPLIIHFFNIKLHLLHKP